VPSRNRPSLARSLIIRTAACTADATSTMSSASVT
jgi:hypothetical protein